MTTPAPTRLQLRHAAEAAGTRVTIAYLAAVGFAVAWYATGDWWHIIPMTFFGLSAVGFTWQFLGLVRREQATPDQDGDPMAPTPDDDAPEVFRDGEGDIWRRWPDGSYVLYEDGVEPVGVPWPLAEIRERFGAWEGPEAGQ